MRRLCGLGVACLGIVAACYPERSVDSTTEFASVTTLVDTATNFSTVTRYAMPDTVLYIPGNDRDEVPAAVQSSILAKLRENLNALGWVEVINPTATNPVDVYVTSVISTETNIYYYWGWWGYWGWYPYWPLSYGASTNWYYPPYWYAYSYETGTLLVSVTDARADAQRPDRIPLVWSFAVNGVLADPATNISIALAGIDQAFAQSPYLGGPPQ
jgi:uncharacterized protein DUF4136